MDNTDCVRALGWDLFAPDPSEHQQMRCRVCDARMDVSRDLNGPTTFVAAMSGCQRPHDLFTCPNSNQKWHRQALQLRRQAEVTASHKIMEILNNEADWVIQNKKCTKTNWAEWADE